MRNKNKEKTDWHGSIGAKPTTSRGLKNDGLAALGFMLPSLLGVSVFFLIPFIDTVRRSFFDAMGKNMVGFSNYVSVFENEAFQLAVKNTARFIAICIPSLMVISLLLALMVRAIRPLGKRLKTSFLLPMAVPVASTVLLWQVLFHKQGLVNAVLQNFGSKPVDFMATDAAFWVLVITYLWKNSGYDMILWLAGLDGISGSLYEAAQVDGANKLQIFWRITLPNVLPTAAVVGILSLLNSFKVFREAFLVAGEYPHKSMYLLQHLFNNWFANMDISRLCAAAVVLCAALLIVILFMLKFLEAKD